MKDVKRLFSLLAEIIYPPRCIFCGKFLTANADIEICKDCFGTIPIRSESLIDSEEPRKAGDCDFVICLCRYSGKIKDLLIRYKFQNKPGYHRALARLLSDRIRGFSDMSGFDMVVSVPLHKSRLQARGYNQAELLAGYLSRELGLPERPELLLRVRSTDSQSLLDRHSRLQNVKGAFKVIGPEYVKDKKILLVDDVYTTGSTMNECSRVLKEAGAALVAGAAVATGK